ncbi:MAG: transposase [Gemmatimonadota bacterium]|nr:transposase [Gemmatimonadota bacterium]
MEFRDERGHALVVRNGRARPQKVTVGSGTVEVEAPRVHDRRPGEKFTSRILPPWMRRSPKVDEVIPVLYLRGLSTRDFREALPVLLGEAASGLSPSSISRKLEAWEAEVAARKKRDLSDVDYVYMWADGVHVNVRLGEQDGTAGSTLSLR